MILQPAIEKLEFYVETGVSFRDTIHGLPGTYKQYQWFDISHHNDVIAKKYSNKFDHFTLCTHFVLGNTHKEN